MQAGQLLAGKYRLEALLGEGGMGAVWVATNLALEKRVALKVMSDRIAAVPGAVERFLREGVAASRVSHPAIVQVFDAGSHDGLPWIAMELLEGESLGARLTRGPLSIAETLELARTVCPALSAVHARGIVHRDLKPENLFLAVGHGGEVVPKLLDFGVAKDDGSAGAKLTGTGEVVGTAAYLAPEQAMGQVEIDGRTDVYALGVVLFECLSCRTPFEAENLAQLVAKMFTTEPRRLVDVAPSVPVVLSDAVGRALVRERDQRTPSMSALLEDLESAVRSSGIAVGYGHLAMAAHPAGRAPAVARAPGSGVRSGATDGSPEPWRARTPSAPTAPTQHGRSRGVWPHAAWAAAGAFVLLVAFAAGVSWKLSASGDSVTTAVAAPQAVGSGFATTDAPALPAGELTPPPADEASDPVLEDATTSDTRRATRSPPPRDRDESPARTVTLRQADPTPDGPPADGVRALRGARLSRARAQPVHGAAGRRGNGEARRPSPGALPPGAPPPGASNAAGSPPSGASTAPTPPPGAVPAPPPPGLAAPRSTEPRAASTSPRVSGGLDAQQLRRTLGPVQSVFDTRCVERRSRRVRDLAGRVSIGFVVGTRGRVERADVVSNESGDAWLGRCARNLVADTRFPTAAQPTTARHTFTIAR